MANGLGVTKYIPKSATNIVPMKEGAGTGASPIQQAATGTGYPTLGTPSVFSPTVTDEDLAGDFVIETPSYDFGFLGDGGGSSAAAMLNAQVNADRLALEQLKYEDEFGLKAADIARKVAGAKTKEQYLLDQLKALGPSGTINPALSQTLEEQRAAREGYLGTQYKNLLDRLSGAYSTAGNLQTQGYNALKQYLESAPPSAFTTAQRAIPTTVGNDVAAYMAGQRVSTAPVTPTIEALNAAAAGGAQNYNNLLTTLAAASANVQQSRLAEQQMAQTLASTQLAAARAAQEGALSSAQLKALQDIQDEYNVARFKLQQDSIAREQALQDTLATLRGEGYTQVVTEEEQPATGTATGTGTGTGTTQAPVANSPAVMALLNTTAAKRTDRPTAVTNRIYDFVEKNPTATKQQVLSAFPNLQGLASLKAKKK